MKDLLRRTLHLPIVRDYGIGIVLLLVCAYLTLATRQPTGVYRLDDEARERMGRTVQALEEKAPAGSAAAVLMLQGDAKQQEFWKRMRHAGGSSKVKYVEAAVDSTPRDVRVALKKLNQETSSPAAVIILDPELRKHVGRVGEDLGLLDKSGKEKVPLMTPPQVMSSVFLQYNNLVLNVASNISIYGIMAAGMTFVILTAGIDLSVGSLIALVSVIAGLAMMTAGGGTSWQSRFASPMTATVVGVIAALLAGAAAGGVQGTIITRFSVPPFIATLAMMQIAKGFALHITQAGTIPDLPGPFRWIGSGFLLPSVLGERLPVPVFLMLMVYLISWLVLTRTTFGRYVYAIGGNEEAARLSGVPVRLVKFFVYVISGFTAALGGIILTARLATGSARYGEGYELYVIASAVVGGTSLFGGEGRILGTLLGALFIAVVNNGLNLTGVSSYIQIIVIGAVILLAVLFDQLKKRWS